VRARARCERLRDDVRSGAQVEITDPATIARVAGILNALPTVPDFGMVECGARAGSTPMPPRHEIELVFHASAGGPALIQATVGPTSGTLGPCDDFGIGVLTGPAARAGLPGLDPTGQNVYARVEQPTGLGAAS
jgi:hypothetical protein